MRAFRYFSTSRYLGVDVKNFHPNGMRLVYKGDVEEQQLKCHNKAHEYSSPCPLQPHGISIAHPAGLLSPLLRVTLEHLQVKPS